MKRWLSLSLVALAACADPTEVVVFVDTTLGVPCEVDTFRIRIDGAGGEVVEEVPAGNDVVSWSILKESGGNAFTVRAEGLRAGRVVASGFANAAFSPDATRQVILVLTEACEGMDCDYSGTLGNLAVPAAATRASCEGIASRYAVDDTLTGLIDVTNACDLDGVPSERFTGLDNDEVLVTDETLAGRLATDFSFRLFGERVERVWVTDDGYLAFSEVAPGATAADVLPNMGITSPGHPRFAVMGFWEALDLQPTTGRVCAALQSAGGRDTLWVTWEHACLSPCPAGDDLTFSIGLEEETNRVIVGFVDMTSPTEPARAAGQNAVVGIMGPEDPACLESECQANGYCADGVTPCGFAVGFSLEMQTGTWPATFVFDPVAE
ncbi:MAG: hypothetical protein RIT81_25695 [Deltaproteobacteria bacterium]